MWARPNGPCADSWVLGCVLTGGVAAVGCVADICSSVSHAVVFPTLLAVRERQRLVETCVLLKSALLLRRLCAQETWRPRPPWRCLLRAFLRHEKLSLAMQMATVSHHSWHRAGRADASTQTMTHSDAATCAATAAPAPVFEYVAPAPVIENIAPVPAVTFDAPSQHLPPVFSTATVATDVNLDITGLVSPQFSSTDVEASAPQVVVSLPPFEEFSEPVYNQVHQEQILTACSTPPVIEYVAPAPVTEYIAPAPAVTSDAHSQQLPFVYTTTTVTTDVNLNIIGLVHPQFSSTAVEPFSPQIVGSLPPLEEFDAPVYNPSHQEQIVAGMTTQHRIENPAVQDQVIVQDIPEVVERIQERILDPIEVLYKLCTCQSLRPRSKVPSQIWRTRQFQSLLMRSLIRRKSSPSIRAPRRPAILHLCATVKRRSRIQLISPARAPRRPLAMI